MTQRPRLVLFPGLGADQRLFEPQRAIDADVEVPPWIPPRPREPLADYATRIATTIRSRPPFYVGGVSFGGMLALEGARHVRPRAVFLISSCRSPKSLPFLPRLLAPVTPLVPARLLHFSKYFTCPARLLFGAATPEQVRLFHDMLRATPPSFLRWTTCAVQSWPGLADPGVPVHHIHGRRDRVIPCSRCSPDETIDGAGHLASLTHADLVNAFLTRHVTAHERSAAAVG